MIAEHSVPSIIGATLKRHGLSCRFDAEEGVVATAPVVGAGRSDQARLAAGRAHGNAQADMLPGQLDWLGAEREFRRALAANPNVAMAYFGLGMLLATQDRIDEGLRHLR